MAEDMWKKETNFEFNAQVNRLLSEANFSLRNNRTLEGWCLTVEDVQQERHRDKTRAEY